MAIMYPNRFTWQAGRDAERAVYNACRDQLDSNYTVFYSVAWQGINDSRRPIDGEADFVIAHANLGVLVLEVKGGSVAYEPQSNRWTSTSAGGSIHTIKDPFEQAMRNQKNLLIQIQIMMPGYFFYMGHSVAFPDGVVDEMLPGFNKPREIILDRLDLDDFQSWVERTLKYYRGKATPNAVASGKDTVAALRSILGKAWQLRPALWGQFLDEREQIVRLTEEQYDLLDQLQLRRRALVSGCAGSGKTMIAAEKAVRLAKQGFKVLLTCFNRSLAYDLQQRLNTTAYVSPLPLDISNFHDLCEAFAKKAGIDVAKLPGQDNDYYNHTLPQLLFEASGELDIRYDAIIADEGQDFSEDWWTALQSLMHDPDNGILYIFYDEQQRIFDRLPKFPIQEEPFLLTKNCRNSRYIHEHMNRC